MSATALNRLPTGRDDAHILRRLRATGADHERHLNHGAGDADPPPSIRPAYSGGLAAWAVKKAAAHVDGHLGMAVRIEHVARLTRLSNGHFGRAFKVSFGVTFLQFLALRRIERSKVLMATTKDRLCDVAQACGFADQTHFSKTFRRLQGVTPSAWRRQRAKRGGPVCRR